MRRIFFLLLALFLFLSSCDEKGTETSDPPPVNTIVGRFYDELSEEWQAADADFLDFNLPELSDAAEYRVITGDCAEAGVFRMKDAHGASAGESALRNYLERETASLSSLAALYPSERTERKLDAFRHAEIYRKGDLLCYFALPQAERETARGILKDLKV